MNDFMFIRQLLLDPDSMKYIIAIQVPILICLIIQSRQAYKMGLNEFKLIAIAWGLNLLYLAMNIALRTWGVDDTWRTIIITTLDMAYMFTFLLAIRNSFETGIFSRIRKISKSYLILGFLIVGIPKCIPGSFPNVPYIHLLHIPVALVNFIVLFLLARYFKPLSDKYQKWPFVYWATVLYATIQFLTIVKTNELDETSIRYIGNIGFGLGMLSKLIILISISHLLVQIIEKTALEEKNKLLHKLKFAKNILNIKDHISNVRQPGEEEQVILSLTLDECLKLLKEKLGYYATYDKGRKKIQIAFASKNYQTLVGDEYPSDEGMIGEAIRTGNHVSEMSEYILFSNSTEDKNVKSALVIPVKLDNEIMGAYMFESETENYFDEIDIDILETIVLQAATAITNIRLIREIESGKIFFGSLKEIDKLIVNKPLEDIELNVILDYILKECLKLADAELGNVSLITSGKRLRLCASTDPVNLNRTIEINNSISGLAVLKKETLYFPDISKESEDIQNLYKNYLGEGLICELAVPLIVKDEVIGVFNTESKTPDKFKNHIQRVEGFAGQAAVAIHNFQLLEAMKKYRKGLETLAEIDLLILTSNQDLQAALEAILTRGLSLIRKDYGEILLLDDDQKNLIIKKSTTLKDEGRSFPVDSLICGLAIEKQSIIYVPFIDKDENRPDGIEDSVYIPTPTERRKLYKKTSKGRMKSELALPLMFDKKPIGVFNIESPEYDDFKQDEINLFKNLALSAAIAIHNAQLFAEITQKNRELENSVAKEKINMSAILGRVINHTIGNAVGFIRVSIKNRLLKDKLGVLNEPTKDELRMLLTYAEKALAARKQTSEKIYGLLLEKSRFRLIDFNEIKQIIDENEHVHSSKNIILSITGFENLPPVYANIDLLMEGIILELIRNAKKAMPNGGKLNIDAETYENHTLLSISDTGHGIREEDLQKIFANGVSLWPGNEESSGIGLTELKTIVEFFDWSVEVESYIGKGSTFRLKIPVLNAKKITIKSELL
jgi:GAF domain-containing protein